MADAGDAWDKLAEAFGKHIEACGKHLHRRLGQETWGGLAAETAADKLGRMQRYLNVAKQELDSVGTVLRAAGVEFATHQNTLKDALADAEAAGYKVSEDGSVAAPDISTEDMQPGDIAMMRRDQATRAQGYADRIGRALSEAASADREYAKSVKLFTDAANRCAKGDWSVRAAELFTASSLHGDLLTELGMPDKNASPEAVRAWWDDLSPSLQAEIIQDYAQEIGNRDGIPAADRDKANRAYLPMLLAGLESEYAGASGDRAESLKAKVEGVKGIQDQLAKGGEPRPYLLGLGAEGNGRAIVSFGNPDTSKNVSAYVPGLNTRLEGHFASADVQRARDVAVTAGRLDRDNPTASIVWLGYDTPQLREASPSALDVMSDDHAEAGAPAYNQFLRGIRATHDGGDPHITALGHSYGSLTVGEASQAKGGLPADDVILIGSPGVGVDKAEDFGVGANHVYVGAADNDQVTKLPAKNPLEYLAPGSEFGTHRIWFGTDPADRDFGGNHFAVEPGQDTGLPGLVSGNLPAHSHYFDPEDGPTSLKNIALVVTGNGDSIKRVEPR
ncbi:alpha/beta hydrolase [Streptomyces sp. HNM0663]|uniref:Alpha/beta hydrolase n=1 Tax=Streptomyces chengmaiensis TaxID=3040919 RepID=A0ABT6HRR3_9ACTN|nr:alpha/beta hydrolase [Streptomyces chengmaiensis]MDH2391295.1 alpha/beta hydrolase [Streptomyces chengmaiensis]